MWYIYPLTALAFKNKICVICEICVKEKTEERSPPLLAFTILHSSFYQRSFLHKGLFPGLHLYKI
ncbi:MAG TPA: hypothetical protein PK730_06530, partial [Candidatus Cloacimonas acidaminovorans]|nr:hypothetical protein [Candidatus Cloacimonas acidaminovorans]